MVKHRYQYYPIQKEIHQIDNGVITQWVASDISNKLLTNIPNTNDNCITIPSDEYPITLFNDFTFRIETSNTIILPNPTFIQDFEEYISSFSK